MKNKFEDGIITTLERTKNIETLEWNDHKSFKGVSLKHLVTGKDTNNQLSCHLVRVDPHCILDTHIHDGILEIHEVIAGFGTLSLDKDQVTYNVGSISVIPANINHKVVAGNEGLYILAKFSPALL